MQEVIGDFYFTISERINLLRETNATLEAIAQALFKSWFVDFDPVHANARRFRAGGNPETTASIDALDSRLRGNDEMVLDEGTAALFPDSFEESELGSVPKGWRSSTLGVICDTHGGHIQTGPFGSQLHASDYVVTGVPVVMPKDIKNRRVDDSSPARIDPDNANRLSRHRLQKHDIVFSRRGDVEKHALIGETEEGWICGTGCLLVRPGKQSNSPGYLHAITHKSDHSVALIF
jgi:type I restriction enzyme S subunit